MDRGARWATVYKGCKEQDTTEVTEHTRTQPIKTGRQNCLCNLGGERGNLRFVGDFEKPKSSRYYKEKASGLDRTPGFQLGLPSFLHSFKGF